MAGPAIPRPISYSGQHLPGSRFLANPRFDQTAHLRQFVAEGPPGCIAIEIFPKIAWRTRFEVQTIAGIALARVARPVFSMCLHLPLWS